MNFNSFIAIFIPSSLQFNPSLLLRFHPPCRLLLRLILYLPLCSLLLRFHQPQLNGSFSPSNSLIVTFDSRRNKSPTTNKMYIVAGKQPQVWPMTLAETLKEKPAPCKGAVARDHMVDNTTIAVSTDFPAKRPRDQDQNETSTTVAAGEAMGTETAAIATDNSTSNLSPDGSPRSASCSQVRRIL
ncbi:hypothetical protein LINPERPRIM_LOCUS14525 [Linum perenne]